MKCRWNTPLNRVILTAYISVKTSEIGLVRTNVSAMVSLTRLNFKKWENCIAYKQRRDFVEEKRHMYSR